MNKRASKTQKDIFSFIHLPSKCASDSQQIFSDVVYATRRMKFLKIFDYLFCAFRGFGLDFAFAGVLMALYFTGILLNPFLLE